MGQPGIRTAFFSKNAASKPVNGQYCRIEVLNGATWAVLAEGCAHLPCDFKMAQLAANTFFETAGQSTGTVPEQEFLEALRATQKSVREVHGLCKTGDAYFCAAAIWPDGQVLWVNIGPTELFIWNQDKTEALKTGQELATLASVTDFQVKMLERQAGAALFALSQSVVTHPKHSFLDQLGSWAEADDAAKFAHAFCQRFTDAYSRDVSGWMLRR